MYSSMHISNKNYNYIIINCFSFHSYLHVPNKLHTQPCCCIYNQFLRHDFNITFRPSHLQRVHIFKMLLINLRAKLLHKFTILIRPSEMLV